MTKEQLQYLQSPKYSEPKTVSADRLVDQSNRTLLFGYTLERDTFHVYLKDGYLHRVIYAFSGKVLEHTFGKKLPLDGIVPSKRLYPSACDYEFCNHLSNEDVDLPFTSFEENRESKAYHGKLWKKDSDTVVEE